MANATWVNPQVALAEAVTAAKLGQRNLARKLLNEITEKDPRNESAWLWIAALSEDRNLAFEALSRVLEINPNNRQALNALALARLQESARKSQLAFRTGTQGVSAAPSRPQATAARVEQPAPATAWKCPLCQAGAQRTETRCSRCGAIVTLVSLEEFAANKGVNDDAIQESIQRHQGKISRQDSFEDRLCLALAYLNLNRSAEALPHLKQAVQFSPGHETLERLTSQLTRRQLILAVDDSLTVRKIVSITLERLGYRVLTAADGMQALARLNEEVPNLVLLDITMPRMDGYQVCKVIKQNPFTRRIPVIMLSGKDGFFDKVKGRLAGATDYITKPFRESTLSQAVAKYVAIKS